MGNTAIAKNTMFLYVRMLLVMGVSLYTSRVVLQTLGVDDYGIYQAVGGIVGLLSFLNGALSAGTSRFLAYELGAGDAKKLKRTFDTLLTAHIALALVIAAAAEICGTWLISRELQIPESRLRAASVVFHVSVVTAFFKLTLVPFSSCVIAREKMSFFAYMSIAEVTLQLGVAFFLRTGACDRIILYSLLLCAVQIMLLAAYAAYTYRRFPEARYRPLLDKGIFKPVLGFSSWSLLANGAIALNNQGVLLILNMFFAPAVVAARAVSVQVNMALHQFIANIRVAVTPSVVKRYAAGDRETSERLCVASARYSYFLMLVLCLPAYFTAPFLLGLWLGEVPEYTVVFVRIIVVQCLFQAFDTSLYTALYAAGRLKENALLSPVLGLLQFPVVFALFRMGCPPTALSWSNLIVYAILGTVVKPVLAVKIAGYRRQSLYAMYKACFRVTLAAAPVPLFLYGMLPHSSWQAGVALGGMAGIAAAVSAYAVGLSRPEKAKVMGCLRRGMRC